MKEIRISPPHVPEKVLIEMWQFILKTSVVSELLEEKLKEREKMNDLIPTGVREEGELHN